MNLHQIENKSNTVFDKINSICEKSIFSIINKQENEFPLYQDKNNEKHIYKIPLKQILCMKKISKEGKKNNNANRGRFNLFFVNKNDSDAQKKELKFNSDITLDKLLSILNKNFNKQGFEPYIKVKNYIIPLPNIQTVSSEKKTFISLISSTRGKNSKLLDWGISIDEIKKDLVLNTASLSSWLLVVKTFNTNMYLNRNFIESITKRKGEVIIKLYERIPMNEVTHSKVIWNLKNKSLEEIYMSEIWCGGDFLTQNIELKNGINEI